MGEEAKKIENTIYWARCILGAILGLIFAAFWRPSFGPLITAISIALLIFIISYYVIVLILGEVRIALIGGKNKVYTIGIGIYFLSWIFFWIFFYTLFFS